MLVDVQPLQGWVVNWLQPRVPLGASPVAIHIDPLRGSCKAVSKTRDRIYETYNLVIRHSIWSETGHSDCGGVPGARVSLVERYGPAPRAFLVVPMAGAFFIDFANALTNV